MRLDRRLADDRLGRDLGVRQAAGDQPEHLEFARAELGQCGTGLVGPRTGDEALDQPLRDRGGEQRLTARDGADCGDELLPRRVLEQEATRAGAGIVHLVRRRGTGLAHVGALLGGLGTIGMAAIAFRHVSIYGLAGIDHASALHVLDRVDNTVGVVVPACMFAGPLALIVLSGAAARAGYVSRWVVAGSFVFFVSDSLPIPGAEILQAAVGIATFGWIARQMLRLTDDQWETPDAPARVESGPGISPVVARAEP